MVLIEDGTGKGFTAKVDNFNRIRAFTTRTTQEHHAATIGEAFCVTTSFLSLPNGFDGPVMILRNDNPSRLMDIQFVLISGDLDDLRFEVRRNDNIGTLANNTSLNVVNTNFDSGKSAQASAWEWNTAGTAGITGINTVGDVFKRVETGANNQALSPDGATILGSNDVWTLRAINSTGGAADFACYVRMFFEGTD